LLQAAQLKAESARASLLTLASDHGLAGPALSAEVDKLVRLGLKAPNDFWERLMSERSQVIIANSNRHGREKVALERKQAMLQVGGSKLDRRGWWKLFYISISLGSMLCACAPNKRHWLDLVANLANLARCRLR
jgi:hypothetical protein